MNKELKKSYKYLDLAYSATIDEVKCRENALLKIYNAKSKESKRNYDNEIKLIEKSACLIVENIKNNGIPKVENYSFECSGASIIGLFIILAFAVFMCVMSFNAFKIG